jgi:L-iditol 2-dehydrogenase
LKTAQLCGPRQIQIVDMPDETPGPGEVLLDVTAVGICGSDLHTYLYWEIGALVPGGPIILGHEAAGVVRALGPGVDTLRVGQRVAIDPAVPCLECERCEAGDPNLCTRLKFIGLWPDQGALRQRMIHPARCCIPVPDSITDVGAALLEPLGVALHAIRLAKIQVGDDVLITGCGAIGLLLIRLAKMAGAQHIYASDQHPWRLALASTYGADTVLNADQVSVADEAQRETGRRGVDVAIESAWAAETTNQCVEAARNGGRVVIVGIPVEDALTFRASPARRKGLTIRLSRRMKHTYPVSIALATSGKVDLDTLATHRFPLARAGDALETAACYVDGVVRAMVLPNG